MAPAVPAALLVAGGAALVAPVVAAVVARSLRGRGPVRKPHLLAVAARAVTAVPADVCADWGTVSKGLGEKTQSVGLRGRYVRVPQ
jgi:hypothetical protein